MFDIIRLLPKVFSTGKAILAVIEDGPTQAELNAAVTEFRGLLEAIPQLRGVLAIFDSVIAIVSKILPGVLDDPDTMDDFDLAPAEVQKALNVATLYNAVMKDAADNPAFKDEMVKLNDVEDMI